MWKSRRNASRSSSCKPRSSVHCIAWLMPELPDIVLYVRALAPRIVGQRLDRVRITSPFLLRSVDPPLSAIEQQTVRGVDRIGKRIVWAFDNETFAVFHLMIAGRFHWRPSGARVPGRIGLAAVEFPTGSPGPTAG